MLFRKRKAVAKEVEKQKKIFDWAEHYPADSMRQSPNDTLELNPSLVVESTNLDLRVPAASSINLDEFLADLQTVFDKHGVSNLRKYDKGREDFRLGYDGDFFGVRSTQIHLK